MIEGRNENNGKFKIESMLLSLLRRESQYCARLLYTGRSPQRGVLLSSIAPSLPAIAAKRSHYSLNTTRTQLVLRTPRSPSQLSMMGLSSSLLNTPAGKFVQDTIDSECVVIFSSTTCGFCKMAKGVFSQMRVPFTAIELNTRKDGLFIRDVLEEITGQTTVPSVFVNSECIGGGTETRDMWKNGELLELIRQCKAKKSDATES